MRPDTDARPGCALCGERPVKARGWCRRCYVYWHATGRARPAETDLRGTLRPCRICGLPCQPTRGMCRTDYVYWWRTGVERPAAYWQPPGEQSA